MDLSSHFLGTYTNRKLQERGTAPLVTIGRDVITRADLAAVRCFNFQAAVRLDAAIRQHLQVLSVRDVFDTVAPSALALPGLGEISIAVLGACFEIKRVGGESPLDNWDKRHADKGAAAHTFASYKRHDAAEAAPKRRRRR